MSARLPAGREVVPYLLRSSTLFPITWKLFGFLSSFSRQLFLVLVILINYKGRTLFLSCHNMCGCYSSKYSSWQSNKGLGLFFWTVDISVSLAGFLFSTLGSQPQKIIAHTFKKVCHTSVSSKMQFFYMSVCLHLYNRMTKYIPVQTFSYPKSLKKVQQLMASFFFLSLISY